MVEFIGTRTLCKHYVVTSDAKFADLSEDDTTLPARVDKAIELFAGSDTLAGYFGEEFSRIYTAIRQGESNAYHAEVPDLDYAWYLRAL